MFALVLGLALLLLGVPVSAQVMPPDTAFVTKAPPDTAKSAAPAPADSINPEAVPESAFLTIPPGERRTRPKVGRFDQPHWVMLRSLAFPGWGQMHNDAWIKAGLIGGTDAYFRVRVIKDNHDLNNLGATADQEQADLEQADQELAEAQASGDSTRIAEASLARNAAAESYNAAVLAYNTLFDQANTRRWMLGAVLLYSLIDAYVDAHFKNFDMNVEYDPALPGGGGVKLKMRYRY